jgi:drug/metabolite transporter (DMT)-like permease
VNNKTLQPYLWILISGFAFSWMVTLAALAGRGTPWQIVAIVRCAIPLVIISLWAKWDGVPLVLIGTPTLWLRSIAGSCSLVGTFYVIGAGMKNTELYTVANIFPIWVALLSWPVLGRMPSGVVWLSIASSIVGVVILHGTEINADTFNVVIVVGVSMFTAVAMMGLNRLKNYDPRAIVVHFSLTALLFACVSMVLLPAKESSESLDITHLLELIGMGAAATVGQYFLTKAFTAGDPARVSVATLSQFVFVLILDVLVLNSTLQWHKLWGIPLILGPTIWLMLRRVKTSALVPSSTESSAIAPTEIEMAICADSAASPDSE